MCILLELKKQNLNRSISGPILKICSYNFFKQGYVYLLAKLRTDWTFLKIKHMLFLGSQANQNFPTKKTRGEEKDSGRKMNIHIHYFRGRLCGDVYSSVFVPSLISH